ncbi:hypothetical protein AgCh_039851 [Apium graveolens]
MIVEGVKEATKRENEGKKRNFEDSDQDQGSSKYRGKFGKSMGNSSQKFQNFKPRNRNRQKRFQKARQSTRDNRPSIPECKLGEFDVTLGMDWLANHDAQIKCRNKKVKLKSQDDTEHPLKLSSVDALSVEALSVEALSVDALTVEVLSVEALIR